MNQSEPPESAVRPRLGPGQEVAARTAGISQPGRRARSAI